jgi:ribosomal-protein-alanine N-acetyltransferase
MDLPSPWTSWRDRLQLVPANASHAQVWWRWRQEESTRRHNPLDDIGPLELASRLSLIGGDLQDTSFAEYRWMVLLDAVPVGTVSLSRPSWRMGYGEIGYMLAEAYHGRGLGTASVGLFVEKVFRETNLVRLTATISTENVASWRLIERLGFTREGMLRQHYVIQGRRVNEYIYGLLRPEWAAATQKQALG